jgi:hypothetical protein
VVGLGFVCWQTSQPKQRWKKMKAFLKINVTHQVGKKESFEIKDNDTIFCVNCRKLVSETVAGPLTSLKEIREGKHNGHTLLMHSVNKNEVELLYMPY